VTWSDGSSYPWDPPRGGEAHRQARRAIREYLGIGVTGRLPAWPRDARILFGKIEKKLAKGTQVADVASDLAELRALAVRHAERARKVRRP